MQLSFNWFEPENVFVSKRSLGGYLRGVGDFTGSWYVEIPEEEFLPIVWGMVFPWTKPGYLIQDNNPILPAMLSRIALRFWHIHTDLQNTTQWKTSGRPC